MKNVFKEFIVKKQNDDYLACVGTSRYDSNDYAHAVYFKQKIERESKLTLEQILNKLSKGI